MYGRFFIYKLAYIEKKKCVIGTITGFQKLNHRNHMAKNTSPA